MMSSTKMGSGSSDAPKNPRPAILGTALAVFVALPVAAAVQPDGDLAVQHRPWSHWKKWLLPVHINAGAARIAIQGTINGVTSVPGTPLVWAVGDGGLILHSSDGGWNWKQQNPPGVADIP